MNSHQAVDLGIVWLKTNRNLRLALYFLACQNITPAFLPCDAGSHLPICDHVYIYIYAIYIYIYIHMCVLYIYIYIYMYTYVYNICMYMNTSTINSLSECFVAQAT